MSAELSATTAVLFSEQSRQRLVEEARRAGALYPFTNARGEQRHWLKGEYAYLAPNAVRAFLDRCNLKHDLVPEEELGDRLAAYRLLFVSNGASLSDDTIEALERWLDGPDRFLVVDGTTSLPPPLLGLRATEPVRPGGYTAWRWTEASPFAGPDEWEPFYVTSNRGYSTVRATADRHATVLTELLEVTPHGRDRAAATVERLGDGVVATPRSLYIANQLFEYLGGAFQAHFNYETVRLWHTPSNWADTLLFFLRALLEQAGASPLREPRLRTFSTYDGVLQVRHDPDHDPDELLDFSMLEYEAANGVPASYYLMDPAFCPTRCTAVSMRLWREKLARYPLMEVGLHNDSAEGDPPTWTVGDGLYRHLAASSVYLEVPIYTAGRHMGFLVYPETIDAMDYLYQRSPEFLGLCTFSLYDVIEFGRRDPEVVAGGKQITYATYDHDNPAIPAGIPGCWFPYRAVLATAEEHRTLRGWDVTHDTDCDPARIDELFEGRVGRSPGSGRLDNGVFTIQYETQAAHNPKYNRTRGHLPFLRYAVAAAERSNFWLTTKRALYERLNDYRAVQFRVEVDGSINLRNPTDRPIHGLALESPTPIGGARANGRRLIHVFDARIVTLPELAPGAALTVELLPADPAPPLIDQPNANSLEILGAELDEQTQSIEVRARVLRGHSLLIARLRPGHTYVVETADFGGRMRSVRTADAAGRLVISLRGATTDVTSAHVTVRPT